MDQFNVDQFIAEYQLSSIENEDNCKSCKGITGKCILLYSKLESRLNQVEFDTYLVGIRIHKKFNFLDEVFTNQNLIVIPYKQFLTNFYTDKITNSLNKATLQDLPDVTIIIDIKGRPRFNLDIRSLYVLGKYKKLKRGVPQTKWPCSECKGRKCETCNYTGQQYPFTVETIIAESFLEASKSLSSSFHGAGREDIDALMLGTGRPFVLELKQPLIRNIDVKKLGDIANQSDKVQISDLRFTDKPIVVLLKNSAPDSKKEYRATVHLTHSLDSEFLSKLEQVGKEPIELKQRTPIRVSHRRADKIREKTIYRFNIIESDLEQSTITLLIEAEGGAYIKEFISGDEGRTTPSITEYLQQPTVCIALDVIKVDDKGLFNLAIT